jgi:hypothetical protein
VYRVKTAQMETAVEGARQSGRGSLSYDFQRSRAVCDHHVFDVIAAHIVEPVKQASSKVEGLSRRDFVNAVLKATGTHDTQHVQETPLGKRKRVTLEPAAAAAADVDVLTATFTAARPYISRYCFVYSFLLTLLRAVLILNCVPGYGRNVWTDSLEGMDVLRFFAVLYTISSGSVLEALRGGAIARGTPIRVGGIYDLRLVNLPCVPSKRMLQRYTPGDEERQALEDAGVEEAGVEEEEDDDESPWAAPSRSATNVANVATPTPHVPENRQPDPEVPGPKRRSSRRFNNNN